MTIKFEQIGAPVDPTFITYEEGKRLREARIAAGRSYQHKRALSDYADFMQANLECMDFTEVHAQDVNRPQAYCLFTLPSQHVWGDSLYELLDNAIERAALRR